MSKNATSANQGGRPPFKPTKGQRELVSIAAGGGMAHDEIALALGISRNTLEKYFGAELSRVAFQRRMDVLRANYQSAVTGNVAAQKAYLSRMPTAAVAPPAPEDAKPPLGKKDQANADAVGAEAGTSWENLLGSRGPVN